MFQSAIFYQLVIKPPVKKKSICSSKLERIMVQWTPILTPHDSVNPYVQVVGQKLENMLFLMTPTNGGNIPTSSSLDGLNHVPLYDARKSRNIWEFSL